MATVATVFPCSVSAGVAAAVDAALLMGRSEEETAVTAGSQAEAVVEAAEPVEFAEVTEATAGAECCW